MCLDELRSHVVRDARWLARMAEEFLSMDPPRGVLELRKERVDEGETGCWRTRVSDMLYTGNRWGFLCRLDHGDVEIATAQRIYVGRRV